MQISRLSLDQIFPAIVEHLYTSWSKLQQLWAHFGLLLAKASNHLSYTLTPKMFKFVKLLSYTLAAFFLELLEDLWGRINLKCAWSITGGYFSRS